MTIDTISTLPTAPSRDDAPATFISRANAFLAALVTMQGELNTSIGQMNTDIASTNTNVTLASEWATKNDAAVSGSDWSAFANASGASPTGSAKAWATTAQDTPVAGGEYSAKHYSGEASDSATAAASSATAAANTANAAMWVSGQAYAEGDNAISGINYGTYRATTSTSGTTDPSASGDWVRLGYSLPDQSGNSGKFLTTNGTAESWGDALPDQTGNAGKVLTTDGSNDTWEYAVADQSGQSGKYLTTDGSTTSWGTVSAGPTQFADSPITISSFQDITAQVVEALKIDDDRDLLILGSSTSTTDCIGVVYNHTTDTWGTETTIRTPSVVYFGAIKIDTDKFLVVTSAENTSIFAKVITISGTTITVGAETTITVVDSHGNAPGGAYGHGLFDCGTAYVLTYPQANSASTNQMAVVMTVSGTTVTAGSETTISGTAGNLYAVSPASGYILFAVNNGSTFRFQSYSISGTTLSSINTATSGSSLSVYYEYGYFGKTSGNHYLFWQNTSTRTDLMVATFDGSYNVTLTKYASFLGDDINYEYNRWVIFDDSNNAIAVVEDSSGRIWYNIYNGDSTSIGTGSLYIYNSNYCHGNDDAIYVRSNYFAQKIDFNSGALRRTNLQNNFATSLGNSPRMNTKSNGFYGPSESVFYNDTRLLITNSQYMYNVRSSSAGMPANSILSADDTVVLHPLDGGADNKIPLISDTGFVTDVKYCTGFEITTAQYRVARMTMS